MPKPDYDTTVARIAGNIASGLLSHEMNAANFPVEELAGDAVRLARAIVAEVKRTEPLPQPSVPRSHVETSQEQP